MLGCRMELRCRVSGWGCSMKGWGTPPELAVSVELGVQSLGRQVVVPKPTALALGQEGVGPPAQHAPGLCLQGHVGQRDVQEGPPVRCVGLWDGRSLIPPAPVSGGCSARGRIGPWPWAVPGSRGGG